MRLLASWRTSLRVAGREARRSKGRSALVLLMIASPVLFLTLAAVSYDMFTLTSAERADRTMGAADARLTWSFSQPIQQDVDGESLVLYPPEPGGSAEFKEPDTSTLATKLPAGTRILPVRRGTVELRTATGVGSPNAISLDVTDPMARGYAEVVAGRAPAAATEVALSEQAVARLGAGIGGTISNRDRTRTYTVVGLVEFPSLLDEVVLFPPITASTSPDLDLGWTQWLVDTPAPVDWAQVGQLNQSGIMVASRAVYLDPPVIDVPADPTSRIPRQELSIGVLVGGLALLEIVLLAGPAFAVSARRRQRQLALVAANGGTPAHVRRMVLADGVVLGAAGAILGIAAGIPAAFLVRPYLELYFSHARAGGYRVFPAALAVIALLAIVTGVLAALVPAFVTARQNVVESLAGRRGITRSRKRWLALGLAMAAVGTVVVVYGTNQVAAEIMLAGLVVGELGIVFCTPAMVGLIARIGRILPLAPRIALRDAARNRASAAPAISAVMAAVAGSVAIGLYFDSSLAQQRADLRASLPAGIGIFQAGGSPELIPANLRLGESAARETLPVDTIFTVRAVTCAGDTTKRMCYLGVLPNPDRECPWLKVSQTRDLTAAEARQARADHRCDSQGSYGVGTIFGGMTVDDGTVLAAVTGASGADAAAAAAVLRAGGLVVDNDVYERDGQVTVAAVDVDPPQQGQNEDPAIKAPRFTFPVYVLKTGIDFGAIISPAAAKQTGMVVRDAGLLITTTRMPTVAEMDGFRDAAGTNDTGGYVQDDLPIERDPLLYVIMAAAALITLAAAAIGTGLAAADGRADLSTLASVGASPTLRRGLSLSQSAVIAGLGSLLGAVAGLGAAVAVLYALNLRYIESWPGPQPLPISVPWLSLGVALLIVPLIAILGAGLLTRSRLPIERRT